ncbi:MAG: group II intron reverse transcriptase/maturase [Cytophagales bacterium]|nr:group II intron reverse transcriptase/maturase [Cytophagales bacterium]
MIERSMPAIASPFVWTKQMLNALSNGVKRGSWYSLYDKVFSMSNLRDSCDRVLENKGSYGVDKVTVSRYESELSHNLKILKDELKDHSYQPHDIRRTYIPKAGTLEKRPLGIPTVRDRVAQTALLNVIEPIFDSEFSNSSFGFRKGFGCKDALRTVITELHSKRMFIVDADIKNYFDELDHEILMNLVKDKISDGNILNLIEMFLKQGIMDGLEYSEPESGSPQGGVISPLLANIYLNPLDKLLEQHNYHMIRYADDFLIMCESQNEAEEALNLVRDWMAKMKLRLHPQKTRIVDMTLAGNYFEFLGYHFEHTRRGRIRRWPRSKSITKLKDTVRYITRRNNPHSLGVICSLLIPHMKGWFQYFKHSNSYTFSGLDGFIRRRMRRILRKRIRKPGTGRIKSDHVKWSNAWFQSQGYVSLYSMYEAEVQSLRS